MRIAHVFFWGDFSLKAMDVIPSFVTIIDEMRYPAHRVELIFHFSLSFLPGLFFHVVGEGVVRLLKNGRQHISDRENYIDFRMRLLGEPGMMPFFFFFYFFFHSTYIRNQLDGFKRSEMMCAAAYKTLHVYIIHTTQCIWAIFRASVYLQNRECVSRS